MALQEDKIDKYKILLDRGNEVFERRKNAIFSLTNRNSAFLGIILTSISIILALVLFLHRTGWELTYMDTVLLSGFVTFSAIAFCITVLIFFPTEYRELKVFEKKHWFSWDNVPGKDNKKLLKYLIDNYFYLSWMKSAKIDKSTDGKTICIHTDENLVEIKIADDQEMAALILGKDRFGKDRVHKLNVEEEENGELRVYDDTLYNFLYSSGEELTRHFLQQLQEDYNYNTEKYLTSMKWFTVAICFFILSIITFICLIIKTILWR